MDLYKYTLENKWRPLLTALQKGDLNVIDEIDKRCIFCADSVDQEENFIKGDKHFIHDCNRCRIDKDICDFTYDSDNDSLLFVLSNQLKRLSSMEIIDRIEKVIEKLEKYIE